MRIIDRGAGPALVLIPGIQGRWEYIGPVVDALASAFRVITFALCDEPASDLEFDGSRGFDNYVEQVRGALDRCGIDRAIVCGISFGGLIALRFAARAPRPDRRPRPRLDARAGMASPPAPRDLRAAALRSRSSVSRRNALAPSARAGGRLSGPRGPLALRGLAADDADARAPLALEDGLLAHA